jgi:N-acetylglutamate synthase-like GNAT family acetyltransferase
VLDAASGESDALIFGESARDLLQAHDVYLGFVDGAPVGCVMVSRSLDTLLIHNLAVAEQYRNCGHATTLVRAVIAAQEHSPPSTYWAAVDPSNPSAVKRFHLLGFVPFDDGCARPLILMMRRSDAQPVQKRLGGRLAPAYGSSAIDALATPPVIKSASASND